MKNSIHFMFSKLPLFNKLNSAAVYKIPLVAKEHQNDFIFLQEFIKRYNRYYILPQIKSLLLVQLKGLAEILSELQIRFGLNTCDPMVIRVLFSI